jgi:hypothetical protein
MLYIFNKSTSNSISCGPYTPDKEKPTSSSAIDKSLGTGVIVGCSL